MSTYSTLDSSEGPPPDAHAENKMLLKSMFEDWDEETLELVLIANCGDAEASVDAILAAGTPAQFKAQQAPQIQEQAPTGHRRDETVSQQQQMMDEILRRQQQQQQQPPPQHQSMPPQQQQPPVGGGPQEMVMVTAPASSVPGATLSITHGGQPFFVRVPPGVAPGQQFIVNLPRAQAAGPGPSDPRALASAAPRSAPQLAPPQAQSRSAEERIYQEQLEISQQYGLGVGEGGAREEPNPPKGRGSRVTLPDDFLRPPGWAESGGGGMTDEELAILLQDEMFIQELANHPEFQQVQEQAGGPGQAPSSRRPSGALSSLPRRSGAAGAAGAANGSSSGSAGGVSYSASMMRRLKALGSNFSARRRGYQKPSTSEETVMLGEGDSRTEASPFHWEDDDAGAASERSPLGGASQTEEVTFRPAGSVGAKISGGGSSDARLERRSLMDDAEAEDEELIVPLPPPGGGSGGCAAHGGAGMGGGAPQVLRAPSNAEEEGEFLGMPSGDPFQTVNLHEGERRQSRGVTPPRPKQVFDL